MKKILTNEVISHFISILTAILLGYILIEKVYVITILVTADMFPTWIVATIFENKANNTGFL